MKKKFYLAIALLLCISSFSHAQNIIDNGYNGTSISPIGATESDFYAQSFIATVNEVSKFGVFLTEMETEGQVILAIVADSSGVPKISAPLYQGPLRNPSTTGAWFYEEGFNVLLTVGQKYWVVIDGYNNAGATGNSAVGRSANYTSTGEGMIYSNTGGIGPWSSMPSMPLAIYVEGVNVIIDENNGWNSNVVPAIGETGSSFYAQSFIANVNEISKFGAVLTEIDPEGELILAIAADNGSGAPDINAPLYQGALRNPSTTAAWFYESGINIPVTMGQKYWVVIDGYNNAGATGNSAVGLSANYTNTGEGMIYSNTGGVGLWSSMSSKPLAIYVSGSIAVIDENNGWDSNVVSAVGETGSSFHAQSFFADVDTITKFGAVLKEIDPEGELILSIAADNGSGAPDINAPLYQGTLRNPSTTAAWFYESGINIPVTVGQKYWVVIDGYNNAGATGNSAVGLSANYTNTGEGMIYSNAGGIGAWSSIPNMRLAIYVSGIPKYPVTFVVTDTTGGIAPVAGVDISLERYTHKLTDAMGLAVYDSVYYTKGDSLGWTATKSGYYPQTGSVVVSDTMNISIILEPINTVTLVVSDTNGVPIPGATVDLNGYGTKITDALGITEFDTVYYTLTPGIPYQVSATGYYPASGNLIVTSDTIVNIELIPDGVGISEISEKNIDIDVYPNPAKDIVNIISTEKILSFEIFTTQGKLVKTVIVEGENAQLKISELSDGNYLLRINTGTNTYAKPLIIAK